MNIPPFRYGATSLQVPGPDGDKIYGVESLPKRKKLTTHSLKHDAFVDGYHRLAENLIRRKDSIRAFFLRGGVLVLLLAAVYGGNGLLQSRVEKNLATALGMINGDVGVAPSADPSRKHYTTQEEKYKAALDAFLPLATKWYYALSGRRDLAQYYVAVCRLHLDPAAGEAELKSLAEKKSSPGRLAKLSLAEHNLSAGKFSEAAALYRNLAEDPGEIPKGEVNLMLAKALAFDGKKAEAVDLYAKIATENRTGEDGRQAVNELALLDPAALDRVPPEPKAQPDTDRLAKYKKE